ncbi:hypothetical protein [Niabella aquatica]
MRNDITSDSKLKRPILHHKIKAISKDIFTFSFFGKIIFTTLGLFFLLPFTNAQIDETEQEKTEEPDIRLYGEISGEKIVFYNYSSQTILINQVTCFNTVIVVLEHGGHGYRWGDLIAIIGVIIASVIGILKMFLNEALKPLAQSVGEKLKAKIYSNFITQPKKEKKKPPGKHKKRGSG